MSKLYTEEQINIAMRYATLTEDSYKEVLERLTPIQLPSDEEIEKHIEDDFFNAEIVHKYNEKEQLLMKATAKAGAKWMKEQILNQNK